MKCPDCGSVDQFNEYGKEQHYWKLECDVCKADLDDKHIKLMKENMILNDALRAIYNLAETQLKSETWDFESDMLPLLNTMRFIIAKELNE
jgi:hypothetical protein